MPVSAPVAAWSKGREVIRPRTASAQLEVVFEVGVGAGGSGHGQRGSASETGGAAKIGVNDDSGGVDHASQRRSQAIAKRAFGRLCDIACGAGRLGPVGQQGAGDVQFDAYGLDDLRSRPALQRLAQGGLREHAIDARQRAQFG